MHGNYSNSDYDVNIELNQPSTMLIITPLNTNYANPNTELKKD